MFWVLWLGALAATIAATPAFAQIAAPGPPGPYVIDVRGATSAIPQDAGFFPPVPTATAVPARGYGLDVGAHVYLLRLGPGRFGIGANVLRVRGTVSPAAPSAGSSPATPPAPAPARPDVRATLTTIAPQISFNFGSSEGWSYVSAGLGRARLTTGTSAFAGTGTNAVTTPAGSVDNGSRSSINVGGGARWFAKARLAFSLDVRVHLVSAGAAEGAAAATPGTTLLTACAGLSLR